MLQKQKLQSNNISIKKGLKSKQATTTVHYKKGDKQVNMPQQHCKGNVNKIHKQQ